MIKSYVQHTFIRQYYKINYFLSRLMGNLKNLLVGSFIMGRNKMLLILASLYI